MDDRMTIAFIAFDGYCDIWEDCMGLFLRFWPDCPYRVLFVNNEKEVSWDSVEVLHAGKNAEWSRKVQVALEATKTPYICLLLEDFLVGNPIDTRIVNETVSFVDEHSLRYFKLVNMNRAVRNRDPIYEGKKYLHVIPQSDEYGVSLQAAIWSKEYLTELIGNENYNAWTFEFDRVHESQGMPDLPNPKCVFDERNVLNLQHGIIQSKYLPGTIEYFEKKGIFLDVKRPVMSKFDYYKYRFQSKVKYTLPAPLRKAVKKCMEKMGYKFVSTVRD